MMSPSQDGEMIKIRAAIEKTVKVPEVALCEVPYMFLRENRALFSPSLAVY